MFSSRKTRNYTVFSSSWCPSQRRRMTQGESPKWRHRFCVENRDVALHILGHWGFRWNSHPGIFNMDAPMMTPKMWKLCNLLSLFVAVSILNIGLRHFFILLCGISKVYFYRKLFFSIKWVNFNISSDICQWVSAEWARSVISHQLCLWAQNWIMIIISNDVILYGMTVFIFVGFQIFY